MPFLFFVSFRFTASVGLSFYSLSRKSNIDMENITKRCKFRYALQEQDPISSSLPVRKIFFYQPK
jgi:hypothetical protein